MSYNVGQYIKHEHPLKTEIYKKGFTISSFASRVGVDRWTLGNIFKNKSMPRGDTINLIANGLEMPYEKVSRLCKIR